MFKWKSTMRGLLLGTVLASTTVLLLVLGTTEAVHQDDILHDDNNNTSDDDTGQAAIGVISVEQTNTYKEKLVHAVETNGNENPEKNSTTTKNGLESFLNIKEQNKDNFKPVVTVAPDIIRKPAMTGDLINSWTTREFPSSVFASDDSALLTTPKNIANNSGSHSQESKNDAIENTQSELNNSLAQRIQADFVNPLVATTTQQRANLNVMVKNSDIEDVASGKSFLSNILNITIKQPLNSSSNNEIKLHGSDILGSSPIHYIKPHNKTHGSTASRKSKSINSLNGETSDLDRLSINVMPDKLHDPTQASAIQSLTFGSNITASEIFIRLLSENLALKKILHHITSARLSATESEISSADSLQLSRTNNSDAGKSTGYSTEKPLSDTTQHTINFSKSISSAITNDSTSNHETAEKNYDFSEDNNSTTENGTSIKHENYKPATNVTVHSPDYYEYNDYYEDEHYSDHEINSNNTNYAVYSDPQPIIDNNHREAIPHIDSDLRSSVRKCCSPSQYFSLDSQRCEDSGGPTDYKSLVQELVLGELESPLVMVPGLLQTCPGTNLPPIITIGITNYTYLLDQGFLYDIDREVHYDHSLYCLELIGHSADTASLTAASCDIPEQGIQGSLIRKCCPIGQYYDSILVECAPNTSVIQAVEDLVHDFSGIYNSETTSIATGTLTCQRGKPDLVVANKAYLSDSDQLCVNQTGRCYPSTMYCIEYIWSSESYDPQPSAVYCPLNSFKKCCPSRQILYNDICIDSDDYPSPFITQLMVTMNSQIGFPLESDQICMHLLMDAYDDIRWWVTNSGFLEINVGHSLIQTINYCVDDSLEPSDEIITMAYVCSNELKNSVVLPISAFDEGTVGKCCPPDHHLSPELQDCVSGGSFNSLDHDPVLEAANVTKLGYTSFPHCSSGQYHLFPFSYIDVDYVEFGNDARLYVVSLDGTCIERKAPVAPDNFCIDYGWEAEDPALPSAAICVPEWDTIKLHTEKYNLTSALLAVSCCSLLIALFSLVCSRVRRGLVTVRKMNTLAGRILISYVTAHLIGFLTLAVSMHIDVKENTASCMLLAGVMQFFLLAGFMWNTSICSESLFLTLRVSTSEGRRFIYHSLWAWGVPALITAFALLMDIFREQLPCGTITPRVGRIKCFFSDPDAALLYLYLPIAVTLVANLVLLITSRTTRMAKLRRLEMGPAKQRTGGFSLRAKQGTSVKSAPNAGQSGMRTHQHKNLWSESMRLVLWSGGTWLFEVVGFIAARYISPPQERWYDYLWYVPASINALRGFGIFFILVMTPETRTRIFTALGTFKGKSSALWKSERSGNSNNRKMSETDNKSNNISMSVHSNGGYTTRNPNKKRNLSVVTTMTNIPTMLNQQNSDGRSHPRLGNSISQMERRDSESRSHPSLGHSISQVERRASTTSSQSSLSEAEDLENMVVVAGQQRRTSLVPVSLPCVDEEDDDYTETSLSFVSSPKQSPSDSVYSKV